MADPVIKIKRSSVAGKIPNIISLPTGEFAINTYDGKVFIQKDQGVGIGSTIIVVNPWSVGTGTNTYDIYFTDGSVGIGTTNSTQKLYVNGNIFTTGIISATTFSGSLALGNITGLGANVATFLATPSSSNLASAVTNETGSGALVFATSPTLVTPILGAASATSVTASGIITANAFNIGVDAGVSTTRTTVATTSATTIESFSSTTYRSARVQVQITQGTNYQASDVLIIHDGSTADVVEYGSIATNDYLGTFSAVVSGGNCLLRINMGSATSATVKVLSQRITV